jgi:hypothetical protein
MQRVPILFRFVAAGMSQKVNKRIVPNGILVWYPEADNVDTMFGHHFRSIPKDRLESRSFARHNVVNEKLEEAILIELRVIRVH